MKSLPEGAGSPISRMPQKTKGGLLPRRHAHLNCFTASNIPTLDPSEYPLEARNMTQVKLLAKGFKYEIDFDGVKLFTKR